MLDARPVHDALHSTLEGHGVGFEEALQLILFSHLQDTYLRKLSRQQELSWLHHSMLEGVGSPLSTSMPAAMCP